MSSSKGKSNKKFSAKKQSKKGREHNPEYVPMLRYGPDTNHLQWCKKIEGVGNLKYGSFASDVCRYGNFGLPDEVDEGDCDLESAAQLVQYKNEIKKYNRELKAMKEKKSKLYFSMWENMSKESQVLSWENVKPNNHEMFFQGILRRKKIFLRTFRILMETSSQYCPSIEGKDYGLAQVDSEYNKLVLAEIPKIKPDNYPRVEDFIDAYVKQAKEHFDKSKLVRSVPYQGDSFKRFQVTS